MPPPATYDVSHQSVWEVNEQWPYGWGGGRIAGPAAPTSRLLEGSILLATDEGGVMMAGGESSTAMADAGMGGDRRQAKGDQNGWELH